MGDDWSASLTYGCHSVADARTRARGQVTTPLVPHPLAARRPPAGVLMGRPTGAATHRVTIAGSIRSKRAEVSARSKTIKRIFPSNFSMFYPGFRSRPETCSQASPDHLSTRREDHARFRRRARCDPRGGPWNAGLRHLEAAKPHGSRLSAIGSRFVRRRSLGRASNEPGSGRRCRRPECFFPWFHVQPHAIWRLAAGQSRSVIRLDTQERRG